jgi:hypothetical protein
VLETIWNGLGFDWAGAFLFHQPNHKRNQGYSLILLPLQCTEWTQALVGGFGWHAAQFQAARQCYKWRRPVPGAIAKVSLCAYTENPILPKVFVSQTTYAVVEYGFLNFGQKAGQIFISGRRQIDCRS